MRTARSLRFALLEMVVVLASLTLPARAQSRTAESIAGLPTTPGEIVVSLATSKGQQTLAPAAAGPESVDFQQSCNGVNCGDDSCYGPPASPVGVPGSFDYQTIVGNGHSHCCDDDSGLINATCDDTVADLRCRFGSCVPTGSRCSIASFCSANPPPIPTRDSPNPICFGGQGWTQIPIFNASSINVTGDGDGSITVTGSFSYIFDTMYNGIVSPNCGDDFFTLQLVSSNGTVLNFTDPAWEKGTWNPTMRLSGFCGTNSGQTLTFRARVNTGGLCTSGCLTQSVSFDLPILDTNCADTDQNCGADAGSDGLCNAGGGGVCVAGPINVASGVVTYSETDVRISGVGPSIFFRCDYNSSNRAVVGPLGPGWSHPYAQAMSLFITGTSTRKQVLRRINERGTAEYYIGNAFGASPASYVAFQPADLSGTVTETVSAYTLTDLDGNVTTYDKTNVGRWVSSADRFGNTISGTYGGSDLTRIQDTDGRGLTLHYVGGGKIDTVTDDDGNQSRYQYDGSNRLEKVFYADNSSPTTPTRSYAYIGSTGLLNLVKDSVGSVLEGHEYDGQNRAMKSFAGATTYAAATANKYSFAYPASPSSGQTVVTRAIDDSIAQNQTTTYQWNYQRGRGLVTQVIGSCSSCGVTDNVQRTFDSNDLLRQEIDGNANITKFTYNADKLVATKIEAFGIPLLQRLTTYSYDSQWKVFVTQIQQPSVAKPGQLKVTTRTWTGSPDRFTQLTETVSGYLATTDTLPTERITVTNFDSRHRVTTVNGPRTDAIPDDITGYSYFPASDPLNNRGRLDTITNALGHTQRFADYSIHGNARQVTDPNAVVTVTTYDPVGRLLTSTLKGVSGCDAALDPLCATDLLTTNVYTLDGDLDYTSLPRGNVIDYSYDAIHRRTEIERKANVGGNGDKQVTMFNTASLAKHGELQEWNGSSYVARLLTDFTYDSNGRLKRTVHSDSTFLEYGYDAAGLLHTVQDEGHASPNLTYAPDALNRVGSVTETLATAPGGVITTIYGHDAHDNFTSMTDANNNITTFLYNDFGDQTRATTPASGGTIYTHDKAGNVIMETDSASVTVDRDPPGHPYDSINRLSMESYSDSTRDAAYIYDQATSSFPKGRLTQRNDPSGSTTFFYDRRGMLVKEQRTADSRVFTTLFGYDSNGNRTSVTPPSGRTYNYTFDFADRPNSIQRSGFGTIASSVTYRPFGPIVSWSYGNGAYSGPS